MPGEKKTEEEVIFIGGKSSGLRYATVAQRLIAEKGCVILKGGAKYIEKMREIAESVLGRKPFSIDLKPETFTGKEGKEISTWGVYIKLKA